MPISDEEYKQTKAKLKKKSKSLLIFGVLILIAAIVMIVLAFTTAEFGFVPALMFPAFFMLFIGMVLCMIGFYFWYATKMDKVAGFMSKATGDSAKYTTEKVTDGFATGLEKHGMSIGGGGKEIVKVKCRNCGYLETEDAEFCSKCGQTV